jgi:hypothetical protein
MAGKLEEVLARLDLCHKLSLVIDETEDEFQKLPIFVRPMARGGFKNKSGKSLADWRRSLDSLAGKLQLLYEGNVSEDMRQQDIIEWNVHLEKLRGYYKGVPAETARFTKDSKFVEEVKQKTAGRVDLIESLLKELAGAFPKAG